MLAWPGYADREAVSAFEKQAHAKVVVTEISSDDMLWGRMSRHRGQDFDVFAVNTAELQRYIAGGLAAPLQTDTIPNIQLQQPRFRNAASIPGLVHAGKVYGVPYTYAEMGLIYDKKQVGRAPDSISILWDPRYRGKILAYNGGSHSHSLAAQALNLADPFHIAPGQWLPVTEKLIALRRNVLAFYTQPEESLELFRQHHVAILFANYGAQQVRLMRSAGLDIGYAIPREGAFAWLDCWALSSGARDKTLASQWINFMLQPEISQLLVTRQGLASTTSKVPMVPEAGKLLWLEPVEDAALRTRRWERIASGDALNAVMQP